MIHIICPMNGVDGHFIVLIGGDGASCVPASRLLSLGGGGDHYLLRLSASVKAQWLVLGRCLVVMVWCFSRRAEAPDFAVVHLPNIYLYIYM